MDIMSGGNNEANFIPYNPTSDIVSRSPDSLYSAQRHLFLI